MGVHDSDMEAQSEQIREIAASADNFVVPNIPDEKWPQQQANQLFVFPRHQKEGTINYDVLEILPQQQSEAVKDKRTDGRFCS